MTELPQRIGPYQVTDLLGQGAMSRVFRATLPLHGDQAYAVKLLRARCTPREIKGFLGECTKVKRLGTHPHIAQVYFAGFDRRLRRYYVAMELVQGPTAAQVLAQAPGHQLPLEQALQIGVQVASALEHAHQRGILHLDVKPSNILWQAEGNLAKLTDFGSARLQEEVSDPSLFPRLAPRPISPGSRPRQVAGRGACPTSAATSTAWPPRSITCSRATCRSHPTGGRYRLPWTGAPTCRPSFRPCCCEPSAATRESVRRPRTSSGGRWSTSWRPSASARGLPCPPSQPA